MTDEEDERKALIAELLALDKRLSERELRPLMPDERDSIIDALRRANRFLYPRKDNSK